MFKVINGGQTPTRATKYSAAVDLYANENVVIGAGETAIIGLGVCIDLDMDWYMGNKHPKINQNPTYGSGAVRRFEEFKLSHYLELHPRSSLRAKGLIAGVGIIDLDFTQEIKIIIHNPVTYNRNFKQFKPDGDCNRDYFYIINGKIGQEVWENSYLDNKMFNDGLIYKTYDIAKYVIDNFYFKIKKGDKIAQVLLKEHKNCLLGVSDE